MFNYIHLECIHNTIFIKCVNINVHKSLCEYREKKFSFFTPYSFFGLGDATVH